MTTAINGRCSIALAVGAAALLAGCGSGSSGGSLPSTSGKSDEQQIRDIDAAASRALASGDGSTVCKAFTPHGEGSLIVLASLVGRKPDSCAHAVDQIARSTGTEPYKHVRLGVVRVSGSRATAGGNGQSETFVKVGGRWLIDGTGKSDSTTIRNADPWTETQVIHAVGLRPGTAGAAYETRSGCAVAVVMTSRPAVDLYAGAGDTVVTNPDGTAGLKVPGGSPKCLHELQRGLRSLK